MNIDVHNNNIAGMFKLLADKISKDLQVCLPAVVDKVIDRNNVDVQPLIQYIDQQNEIIDREIIKNIKLISFGTSKYIVSVPIQKGDIGLLIAPDRDTSLFLQSKSKSKPATTRKHDFSDAFFIPICFEDFKPDSDDEKNLILSTVDKKQKISIGDSKITLKSDVVEINGVIFDKNSNITTKGDIKANDVIPNEVIINGIKVSCHKHLVSKVQPGAAIIPSEGMIKGVC